MADEKNIIEEEYDNSSKKLNVCGLLSFIFSMVALLIFGLPLSITSVILGIIGLTTFKPAKQKARWLSITGLTIGAIEFVIMIMYFMIMAVK